jgi:superfamily II DNA or RNA helicase
MAFVLPKRVINLGQNDIAEKKPIPKKDPHTDKLLPYQKPHFYDLENALLTNNTIIDSSDTGTGKTYVVLALAKKYNLKPFIICPKSVISFWVTVSKFIGVQLGGVSNYEMFQKKKYFDTTTPKMKIKECEYIQIEEVNGKNAYKILFPQDYLIIYDEVHRCKSSTTINSKILKACKMNNNKIALLSATIIEKIDHFKKFGFILGFYNEEKNFGQWIGKLYIDKNVVIPKEYYKQFSREQLLMKIVHKFMFPDFGGRMSINEISKDGVQNLVSAVCYNSDNIDKINKQYDHILRNLKYIEQYKAEAISYRAKIMKARMDIEMSKLSIMEDLAEDALENGYSVILFVNFRESVYELQKTFQNSSVVIGDQTQKERDKEIQKFQDNINKVIILTTQSGGVGLSLHDIHGGHPRMSIINPSFSAIELKQSLGRAYRAGCKSNVIQRIVFCSNTYEEKICKIISDKLNNISLLNDNDLSAIDLQIKNDDK